VVPLSQKYNRQVLIPEMDFHSFDGVNTTPIGTRRDILESCGLAQNRR
jgi:hypothetical protein